MPLPKGRGSDPVTATTTRRVVSADFYEFPDKTLIELIADARSSSGLSFVVFEKGRLEIRDSYVHGEELFVPALPTSRWARVLQLPLGFGPKLPYEELFGNIVASIKCFVDVDNASLAQLAAFVLATWLPGRGPTAPLLLVVGPVGSGKTTLLKVISCLCRRSLLVAGAKPQHLHGLPNSLRPTLILDEVELDKPFCQLMRLSHTAGVLTCHKGEPIDLFGPKVISCREMPDDEALISRCTQVTLAPSSKSLRSLTSAMMNRIRTVELPALLTHRLVNYHKCEDPKVTLDHLAPRTRDIASSLMSVPDRGRCTSLILTGLKRQDEDRMVDRGVSERGLLLEQLFVLCHSGAQGVLVGGFSKLMNTRMQVLGQPKRYTPKEIGVKLRSMGLFTNRTRAGYALQLWGEVQQKIHQLAKSHGVVITDPPPVATCAWCLQQCSKVEVSENVCSSSKEKRFKMRRCGKGGAEQDLDLDT
jgi:energy-coupling factor transporter ATP-binding protein EcfA2